MKLTHNIVGHIWTNQAGEVTRCRLSLRENTPHGRPTDIDHDGPDAIEQCAEHVKAALAPKPLAVAS